MQLDPVTRLFRACLAPGTTPASLADAVEEAAALHPDVQRAIAAAIRAGVDPIREAQVIAAMRASGGQPYVHLNPRRPEETTDPGD